MRGHCKGVCSASKRTLPTSLYTIWYHVYITFMCVCMAYVSSASNVHECVSLSLSQCRALSVNVWVRPYLVCSDTSSQRDSASRCSHYHKYSCLCICEQVKLAWSQQREHQPTPTLANALQSPSVSLLAFCAL